MVKNAVHDAAIDGVPATDEQVETFNRSVRDHGGFFNTSIITCLLYDGCLYWGDVVQKTEEELRKIPNFGLRSALEVKKYLAKFGLLLGTTLVGWNRPTE